MADEGRGLSGRPAVETRRKIVRDGQPVVVSGAPLPGRTPSRSTLVCPSCRERMLYVPGGVTYRCDECKQVWQCVWEAEKAPARGSSPDTPAEVVALAEITVSRPLDPVADAPLLEYLGPRGRPTLVVTHCSACRESWTADVPGIGEPPEVGLDLMRELGGMVRAHEHDDGTEPPRYWNVELI